MQKRSNNTQRNRVRCQMQRTVADVVWPVDDRTISLTVGYLIASSVGNVYIVLQYTLDALVCSCPRGVVQWCAIAFVSVVLILNTTFTLTRSYLL